MDSNTFEVGQRVRIKIDAFPGSNEIEDINARGQIGLLVDQVDDDLWMWQNEATRETTFPISSELESVEG